MNGWVYVWMFVLFNLKTGKSEKDDFGLDAEKYIGEVKKALG